MRTKLKKFSHFPIIASLLLILAVLGGSVLYQEYLLAHATKIILKTAPLDPRDPFRGDYVILRYEIQDQAIEWLQRHEFHQLLIGRRQKAYFILKPKAYKAQVVSLERVTTEKPHQDQLFIAADISTYKTNNEELKYSVYLPDISQYYVTEGQGKKIEDKREGLHVEIALVQAKARVLRLLDENLQTLTW